MGRTRILATHHLDLCIPKTKYAVLLGDGTVENAGFVDEFKKSGVLEKILQQEEAAQGEEKINDEQLLKDEVTNTLHQVLSRTTEASLIIDDEELPLKEGQPRIFTEEEKRERGKVKFGIYKEYLNTSGGWLFWVVVLAMFVAHQGLILGRVGLSVLS